ncbi:MAG: hypothetical protein IJO63_03895 [Bacilli bacterium]|nr:hypothetical protein [Bacilli bacterium]
MYKKIICPRCSKKELVEIIYGMPSSEMFDYAKKGLIKLGGCEEIFPFLDDTKEYYCNNCECEINLENDKDLIFEYRVIKAFKGPFNNTLFSLRIYDRKENNLEYSSLDEDLFEIKDYDIKNFINIVNNNLEVFNIKEIPFPSVLDGVEDYFYIKKDNLKLSITGFNFFYYMNNDECPKCIIPLVNILDGLYKDLIKKGCQKDIKNYFYD